MQTCSKCKTRYEDEQTVCPVCGAASSFVPAEGLTAFLTELRKEKDALERKKSEQSAQLAFDLRAEEPVAAPVKENEAPRPWRMVWIVLLAIAAIVCCFSPFVYENGRIWLSGYEEILLLLDNAGLQIFSGAKELSYFGQELPEYLRQGAVVTEIGILSAASALFCLCNLFVSFFTVKYRAGAKWTMVSFSGVTVCVNIVAAVLVCLQYGWKYIGYGLVLQTAAALFLTLFLFAGYRKRRKKNSKF